MISKYSPVNFTEINYVELVPFYDSDYIEWQKKVYGKKQLTDSQTRRKKEIEEYPEFFNKIKEIFIHQKQTCENCFHRKEDYYTKNKFVCWKKYNDEYPNRPGEIELDDYKCNDYCYCIPKEKQIELEKISHPNNIFARFYTSNAIQYYLCDLGLWKKENIKRTAIGESARKLEKEFKIKLKSCNRDIIIIEELFKIYTINNKKKFKIPDLIFCLNNEYSIVEYKSNAWEGTTQQLEDYKQLYLMATDEKDVNTFWVIHNCFCFDYAKKNKEKLGIYVFKEDDFLEKFGMQTGLSAWM